MLFDVKPKIVGTLTAPQFSQLKQQSEGFSRETEDVGMATDKQFAQLKNYLAQQPAGLMAQGDFKGSLNRAKQILTEQTPEELALNFSPMGFAATVERKVAQKVVPEAKGLLKKAISKAKASGQSFKEVKSIYTEQLGFPEGSVKDLTPIKLNGKVVGAIDASPKLGDPEILKVHYVRILPEAQGKGLGRQAVSELFDNNPKIKYLEGNATAESRPFWEKIGAKFPEDKTKTYFTIDRSRIKSSVANDISSSIKSAKQSGQSFDEWVKGQGLLFHGTDRATADAIRKAGGFTEDTARIAQDLIGGKVRPDAPVSLTLDEATGKLYAGPRPSGGQGELLSFSSKGLKIASEAEAKGKTVDALRKAGYDGFHTSSPHDEMVETIIFNKEKLKLTSRSQLKAEWDGVGNGEQGFGGIKELIAAGGIATLGFMTMAQFNNVINIQNEPTPEHTQDFSQIEPLRLNGREYKPLPVPQEYQQAIQSAYQEHPELPKGVIEAVLMKESEMGTNKKADNIAELKPSAIQELQRKKIPFDLTTDEGVILAAGDYLAHRMKIVKAKDAVDLYMRGYYGNPNAKLDKQIFEYYLTAY